MFQSTSTFDQYCDHLGDLLASMRKSLQELRSTYSEINIEACADCPLYEVCEVDSTTGPCALSSLLGPKQ